MSAQVVIGENNQLPFNYQIKVKQFNEFVDRFNYERDFLNQDIGPSFSDKITRQQYIGLLFDHSSITRNNSTGENAGNNALIVGFIQTVNGNCNAWGKHLGGVPPVTWDKQKLTGLEDQISGHSFRKLREFLKVRLFDVIDQ